MSARYVLLALLSEGPKHGLQLREEFEAWAGGVWPPLTVSQVDTALKRLERDGLVEPDGTEAAGPQKGFRTTADGTAGLARWLRMPPDLAPPPRDELVMKILVALRVPGTDVHEVIQVHRRYLVELMQQWTRVKQDKADHDLGPALVVNAELSRLNAVIRWLDAADGRLGRAAAGSPPPAVLASPWLRVTTGWPPGRTNQPGTGAAADDRIRIGDADRERVTIRLRDHFAEGRLTREELDERVTAALKARTASDLRAVMADLPGPTPALCQGQTLPPAAVPSPLKGRRSPLLVPLALLGVLLITGSRWPFFVLIPVVLVLALITCAAPLVAAAWHRRRIRRH